MLRMAAGVLHSTFCGTSPELSHGTGGTCGSARADGVCKAHGVVIRQGSGGSSASFRSHTSGRQPESRHLVRFGGQDLATRLMASGGESRSMKVFLTTNRPARASRGSRSSKASGAGRPRLFMRPSAATASAQELRNAGILYKPSAIVGCSWQRVA